MIYHLLQKNIRFIRNVFAQDSIYWKEKLQFLLNKNE